MQTEDGNQRHEQGCKEDAAILERVGQEQNAACNEPVAMARRSALG